MEPNLWRRGVMEELLPPLTLGKQEQANPKSEIYSPFPPATTGCSQRSGCDLRCHVGTQEPGLRAPSALRWVMLCSPGTPWSPQGVCPSLRSAPALARPHRSQPCARAKALTLQMTWPSLFTIFTFISPWQFSLYLALFSLLPERIPSM